MADGTQPAERPAITKALEQGITIKRKSGEQWHFGPQLLMATGALVVVIGATAFILFVRPYLIRARAWILKRASPKSSAGDKTRAANAYSG